jgi:hypothetical protein
VSFIIVILHLPKRFKRRKRFLKEMKKSISRAAYVEKLRRAFLLRAHPDRFRRHSASIRQGQTNLLSALSARLSQPDFQNYTTNSSKPSLYNDTSPFKTAHYVLQKRDGSLLKEKLDMNDTVENILKSLSKALENSGAVPPTPPTDYKLFECRKGGRTGVFNDDIGSIDRRFDINTARGRDLLAFLKGVDSDEIEKRRSSRMDAIALASEARRLYSFSAVDGISLGWSSKNFAVLLSSLVKLHDEHSENFKVESFYPLRLVFNPDEFRIPLDVYGGNLYIHPSSTQLQWLEALQDVTVDSLLEFQEHRQLLQERTAMLQSALGIKVMKGHSCTSKDYHVFLKKLSSNMADSLSVHSTNSDSKALQMEWLRLVVESPLACRRTRLTNEGHIRVNTWMSESDLRKAISKFAHSAQDRIVQEKENKEQIREVINQIQYNLGLQKVYRSGVVSHVEFTGALSRLLQQNSDFKRWLSGHSLGITAGGQFCHLGDDGSMIVPHDWR